MVQCNEYNRNKNLTKKFGDKLAVDDISFEVKEGRYLAFWAPNGAGKTTTISILCTLLQPTNGIAKIAGMTSQRRG